MKTVCSFALLLALALASACAPKVNDPADIEAIRQLMDGYFKAASAKDSSALDAVLTDKTLLLEPHMKPLVGKEAIGKMHQAFLAAFDIDAKGPATEVRVAGDLAVAYGRYEETITPKDTTLAAAKASGHWVAVLERQGGAWTWGWVIANSDQPLPGATADGADEQALLELERDFMAAAKERDMAFFDRHVAKEYVQIVDGKPVNFAAVLADMKAGLLRIDTAELRDMKVHVTGDAAIVSLAGKATGTYKGTPFADGSKGFDVFAKRDGRWQVVYSQMTSIKE
jgi:uncharacterized protein (TIGR02246 family)